MNAEIDRGLEETLEILSDPHTSAALESGLAELLRGEVVTRRDLKEELMRLRAAD